MAIYKTTIAFNGEVVLRVKRLSTRLLKATSKRYTFKQLVEDAIIDYTNRMDDLIPMYREKLFRQLNVDPATIPELEEEIPQEIQELIVSSTQDTEDSITFSTTDNYEAHSFNISDDVRKAIMDLDQD